MNSHLQLLQGIQNKKIEAFEELYKLYYSDATIFAQTYVYRLDIAEDLVQECIQLLWESSKSLNIKKSLKSYLYSAIRNKCINYLRHLQVEDKYRSKEMHAIQLSEAYDILEDEELIQKVKAAIDNLPEKSKLTFKMAVLQDMKYSEIAEELNISINTVKDSMKRAYRILREYQFDDYLKLVILLFMK